jgi:hypothetical protein
MTTDEMKQKAIEIIAATIKKNITANTMMDYGTLGREVFKNTKRQSEAKSMAVYFAKSYMTTLSEDEQIIVANEIATAAVEIVGK